jgi:L-2,4-diaminobutyrate decarboxylase
MRLDPPPLDRARTPQELREAAGTTITPEGIGGLDALRVFEDVLAPACISVDHPRFLSFVPAAPTEASMLFDLVVGASSVYAGSWLEGAGAIHAENEALRWIADLVGMPDTAGGVFVSGGTAGNLSALIAARWRWRHRADGAHDRVRGLMLASAGAHSSVAQAARAMDADVVVVAADDRGRMQADAVRSTVEALDAADLRRVFAVVATAGTTNAGVVDDLAGAADVASDLSTWFHVDGAYGGAALAAPSVRHRFDGIERADSFIVDPHKWLFAPFDSCALLYRDPAVARSAHTQHAEYLDVLHAEDAADEPWNASDYAHHLSRRARGLPLWFSLATHGTDAYTEAVETTLETTRGAARLVEECPVTELLMEPELSIVLFRRIGWDPAQYQAWSDAELAAGRSFVVPTTWQGETVLRFCIVNPRTSLDDIRSILATLRDEPA